MSRVFCETWDSSVHSWRCGCQRRAFLRQIDYEPTRSQLLLPAFLRCGSIPSSADLHSTRVLGHLGRLATLLVHIRFHHLCCQPRRELSVLAAFEQNTYNQFRVPPRRHSHEPCIVLVILLSMRQLGFSLVADCLGAAGLPG